MRQLRYLIQYKRNIYIVDSLIHHKHQDKLDEDGRCFSHSYIVRLPTMIGYYLYEGIYLFKLQHKICFCVMCFTMIESNSVNC